MIKPKKLNKNDLIATISPSWGCAGASDIKWKYDLGVMRLKELGLNVIAAPNSLKGEAYLQANPKARAEDFMWAFQNTKVNGVIANIGGDDSEKILPFISNNLIQNNPKVLCGYSDIMSLHLYCNQLGLTTFYGDNLLTTIAEAQGWHPYSKYWFKKVLFDSAIIGEITPPQEWSPDENNHIDKTYIKRYTPNSGYQRIQGHGVVMGELFGGHIGMMEYATNSLVKLQSKNFKGKILFIDIPALYDTNDIKNYFQWLGVNGYLQVLNGIIIGKLQSYESFETCADRIKIIVSDQWGMDSLPIMYGLSFGHSNPIFVLPYGVKAKLDIDNLKFSISESGVV